MKVGKYTLIFSEYNEETGESVSRINTDVGTFEGCAKLHPEEKYESKYLGCQIAELRALKKYCRELVKIGKAQKKALIEAYNTLAQMTDFKYDSMYASKLRRAIAEKNEWICARKNDIIMIEIGIERTINEYATVRDKMMRG